ncbi:MAG TPA: NAD-dependent epimerase/dehydratase family protein [Gemmatimonas sp.]|nr:NAD-dependent epimerase/dehydratase family protein [Gemmatimonas sp.]
MTGASGFVGGAVTRALHEAGHHVLPFGRRTVSNVVDERHESFASYTQWDITDAVRSLDVDAVVHCAALVRQCAPRREFWRSNVSGTRNVIAGTPQGARFVYVSTASVYAPHSSVAIAESASCSSSSRYGGSKRAGEELALAFGSGAVVLRPHIVYGPGDTTLWPRVMAACRGGVLTVPGTGHNRISVTHLGNLVDAVCAALQPCAPGGIYNIADDEAPTVDELLRTMFSRRGLSVKLRYVPKPLAWIIAASLEAAWRASGRRDDPPLTRFAVSGLADSCVLDTTRARNGLGYMPRCNFRDGPL